MVCEAVPKQPTLEVRVADAQLQPQSSILVALLCRGLVATLLHAEPGTEATPTGEFLDAALWHAARYGLGRQLVHPLRQTLVPAADAVDSLLDAIAPALTAHGDLAAVTAMLQEQQALGPGAHQQRKHYAAGGRSGLGNLYTASVAGSMGTGMLGGSSDGVDPGGGSEPHIAATVAGPGTAHAQLPDPAL